MQERDIFNAALGIDDAAEQERYVRQACGDNVQMQEHLLGLLAAQRKLGSFLEAAPVGLNQTNLHVSPLHHPGDLIAGRYKLLEQVGVGGMGAVWLAEQKEPVKRKVAIKLVKAGMDSQQVLARFEAERQALALMDHPNIAKVFDGGMTEQGRPFFVMEFVKGVPFTEYCNEARLSLKDRLHLFIPVCQAVQHAHQKGVIHRDLKPSNILICLYDGKPVPKVIDFGLAKAMHQSLTDNTIHTALGMMVGTPLYMSPEQAEHNNLDVDTRSDIYSLGVILYELLTGTTPLEQKQLTEAAYNEVLRLIKEVEPPKPSTRLSGSASLPSIAAQRSIDPNQLGKSLSGDLDWIVMKSLDKERSRRYETANGLARDVERFLNDEAVEASPPSSSYRLKKLMRKHRTAITSASAFAALLLVGTIISVSLAAWALRAEDDARKSLTEEAKQRTLAQKNEADALRAASAERAANAIAEKALKESEAARRKTREALNAVTDDVIEELLGRQAQLDDKQKSFLRKVENLYADFAKSQGATPQAQIDQADGLYRVAKLRHMLGERSQPEKACREAEEILTAIVNASSDDAARRLRSAVRTTLAGILMNQAADPLDIESAFRLAIHDEEYLLKKAPNDPQNRHNLGAALLNLAIATASNPERQPENEANFVRALSLLEGLENPASRLYLSSCLNNLGAIYARRGEQAQAEAYFRQALERRQRLADESPNDAERLDYLARTLTNLAAVTRDPREQVQHFERAISLQEKVFRLVPGDPRTRLRFGAMALDFSRLLAEQGAYERALEEIGRAVQIATSSTIPPEMASTFQSFSLDCREQKAAILSQMGKHAEAVQELEQAIPLYQMPSDRTQAKYKRGMERIAAGQVADAITEALEAANSPTATSDDIYQMGCVVAIASTKILEKQQRYADQAMELLQKAVNSGWKDAAHMSKDADLDPLRERQDFKKLLAELLLSTKEGPVTAPKP